MGMSVGQSNSIVPEILEENESPVAGRLADSIKDISPSEVASAWESMAVSTDGADVSDERGLASRALRSFGTGMNAYGLPGGVAAASLAIGDSLGIPQVREGLEAIDDAARVLADNVIGPAIDAVSATRALDRKLVGIVVDGVSNMASEAVEALSDFVKAPFTNEPSKP